MFLLTYKTTLKTLLRSVLLWIALALVLSVVVERALSINYSRTLVEDGKIVGHVMDTDPEYKDYLDLGIYVQTVHNSQYAYLMPYAMPLFAVISTILVVTRDYRDNFFEIEKASGIKAARYLLGRLAALLTVNSVVCITAGFVGLHTYFFSRYLPNCFTLGEYLIDSTVRVLRIFCCAEILSILLYIAITYMAASLLHSGFKGAIVGVGYAMFIYGTRLFLKQRMPQYFLDFLTPQSMNHYTYWGFYDYEIPGIYAEIINPFKPPQVLLVTGFLLGSSLLFFTVSYICIRRRNI